MMLHQGRRFRSGIMMAMLIGFVAMANPLPVWIPIVPAGRIQLEQSPEEWQGALKYAGSWIGNAREPRYAEFFIAATAEELYLSVISELPPHDALIAETTGNELPIFDDGIEIWIVPPSPRESGSLEFGEFQGIFNSKELFWGRHHNPGYGLPARQWLPAIECRNQTEGKSWTWSARIPVRDLGISNITSGQQWRFLLVRNFQRPRMQASFVPLTSFTAVDQYLPVVFGDGLTPRVNFADPADLQPSGVSWTNHTGETTALNWELRAGTRMLSGQVSVAPGGTERVDWSSCNLDGVLEGITFATPEGIPVWCYEGAEPSVRKSRWENPGAARYYAFPEEKPGAIPLQTGSATLGVNLGIAPPPDGTELLSGAERLRLLYQEGKLHLWVKNTEVWQGDWSPGQWLELEWNAGNGELRRDDLRCWQGGLPDPAPGEVMQFAPEFLSRLELYNRPLLPVERKRLWFADGIVNGSLSWFPSLQKIVVDAELAADAESAELILRTRADGDIMRRYPVPLTGAGVWRENGKIRLHQAIPIEPLEDGNYYIFLALPAGEILQKEITVHRYAWSGNTLGTSRMVIPPFTPLERDGMQLSCLLRRYRLAATGLPEQISARGEKLLARPVTLELPGHALAAGEIVFEEESPDQIRYRTVLAGEGFDIEVCGEFAYDGLLKLNLRFIPGPDKPLLERGYVDIPLSAAYARLFHGVGMGLRTNPAGAIPEGTGKIWGSREILQTGYQNFIPYVWVGDEERGVCYAADHDRNWVHADDIDAVELRRDPDGTVILRLNLVSRPTRLESERSYEFALMATPVKARPEGWRGWSDAAATLRLPGTRLMQCLYSPPYWGSYYGWMSRYPDHRRFEFIEMLNRTREGRVNAGEIQNFIRHYLDNTQTTQGFAAEGRSFLEDHAQNAFAMMKTLHDSGEENFFYPYTCLTDRGEILPEYPAYRDEWEYHNAAMHTIKSVQDYSLYYFNQMLDAGAGGVYLDNTFFAPQYAWPMDEGWLDADGTLRPSFGLWRSREYIRRLAVLMTERGMPIWITVHNTNTMIYPVMSAATNTMGMEWKYGNTDFQERFTPDYIRTVNSGLQGGFFPAVLGGITDCEGQEAARLTRTMLAMLWIHEIQPTCGRYDAETVRKCYQILWDFGKAEADCRFLPYWEENPAVSASPGWLISAYQRDNRLLLIVADYNGLEDVEVRLNLARLGASSIVALRDAETKAAIAFSDNSFQLPFRRHDLQLIEAVLELPEKHE